MDWHKNNLRQHYEDHPCVEDCWGELLNSPVSISEYERQSYKTVLERCAVEYSQIDVEVEDGSEFHECTNHFVDEMIFTTILVEDAQKVKTHFHIHRGGKSGVHESGSLRWSLEDNLNILNDRLHDTKRFRRTVKFEPFSKTVPKKYQDMFRKLAK